MANTRTSCVFSFLALSVTLGFLVPRSPANAHEIGVIPAKRPDAKSAVLPVIMPADHFAISPAMLDFGQVLVGETATRFVELTNVSGHDLTVTMEVGSMFSVSPAGPVVLPAGAPPLSLAVTAMPDTAGDLASDLAITSTHTGVTAAAVDTVPITGGAFDGPQFELRINGQLAESHDFGNLSRRPRNANEDAPRFFLDITNVGDLAGDVQIFLGPGFAGDTCSPGPSKLCVAGTGSMNVPGGILQPGETFPTVWRLFIDEVGALARTVMIETDAGDLPVDVSAVGVPYLVVSSEGSGEGSGNQGGGDNIDPTANDPFDSFRPTGFDPGSMFDVSELDTVDIRSGNLVFGIPLGGPFPVRGNLSYAFGLTYNSNVWARRTFYPVSSTSTPSRPSNLEYPSPTATTAFGWTFTLGRLLPPVLDWEAHADLSWQEKERRVDTGPYWTYAAPDGSQHRFSKDLNHAVNPHAPGQLGAIGGAGDNASDLEYLYARDGSHLRLHRVSATERHVEFPDGTIHVFEPFDTPVASHPDRWRLVHIRGPFFDPDHPDANAAKITYNALKWIISDPWRTHTVFFEQQPADFYSVRVKRIELAAFAGQSTRKYLFAYDDQTASSVNRPSRSTFHFLPDNLPHRFFKVPLLSSVTLPDGGAYTFSYRPQAQAGQALEPKSLLLEEVTLPTGGKMKWDYGTIQDTTVADCVRDSGGPDGTGVVRRRAFDADGGVLADTRYIRQPRRHPEDLPDGIDPDPLDVATCAAYHLPWSPDSGNLPPHDIRTPAPELVVGVWTDLEPGLSSLGVHYFSIWPFEAFPESVDGWTKRERGLQLTRARHNIRGSSIASRNGGARLSRELYSCPRNTTQAVGGDPLTAVKNLADLCSIETAEYRKYELPAADLCETNGGKACHVGARVIENEVLDYTDLLNEQPRWVRTTRSEYDGLGHHRRVVTRSDWPGHKVRTTFRNHNAGLGPLVLDADGNVQTGNDVTLPTAPWILDTYTDHWIAEGDVTMGGEACFDANNGRLKMARTWKNAARGPDDVIVRDAHDGNGELRLRRFFGADTGTMPGGAGWCDAGYWSSDLDDLEDYRIAYDHQHGVLSEERVAGESVFAVRRTIDAGTGWVAKQKLDSGEEITHAYDPVGRLTSSTRHHAANVVIAYDRQVDGHMKVTATTYPTGQTTGSPIRWYIADLDGLGRVVREEVPGPPGAGSVVQHTSYHPSGNKRSVSSLDAPNRVTRFEWDARGRLRERRGPNHPSQDANPPSGPSNIGRTVYEYSRGTRVSKVKNWVDSDAGRRLAETRTERDAYGRVISVELPEGATTTFAYDPLGNRILAQRGVQKREWHTDGRGFVTLETIPERPVSAAFSDFDTRGNAGRVVEGGRTKRLTFDNLGRLTHVKVKNGTTFDILKKFVFGPTVNTPANGRLIRAERHNYRDGATSGSDGNAGNWKVFSSFTYDAASRVIARDTKVRFDWAAISTDDDDDTAAWTAFEQGWTYDDVGNVETVDYPARVGNGSRQLTNTYARGVYLTGVSTPNNLGAQLTYHRSGLVHQVIRQGAGTDTYAHDPTGVARWSSMRLAGGALDLSPVTYDPSGNVTQIGNDAFTYDRNGRLERAQVQGTSYAYGYDQYDNFDESSGMGTVDPANNQLVGGVFYDAFGNTDRIDLGVEATLVHDALDKLAALHFGGPPGTPGHDYSQLQIYDHDDLRIMMHNNHQPGAEVTWTLRGAGGRVLSEFRNVGPSFRHEKDFVYAGTRLLATRDADSGQIRRYHGDQLGSARYVTISGAPNHAIHYRPFGGQIAGSGDPRVGFTGHENDGLTTYMRARTYLPVSGRFLQVDPGRDASAWSLYTYASNSPLRRIDKNGLDDEEAQPSDAGALEMLRSAYRAAYSTDPDQVKAEVLAFTMGFQIGVENSQHLIPFLSSSEDEEEGEREIRDSDLGSLAGSFSMGRRSGEAYVKRMANLGQNTMVVRQVRHSLTNLALGVKAMFTGDGEGMKRHLSAASQPSPRVQRAALLFFYHRDLLRIASELAKEEEDQVSTSSSN